MKEEEEKTIRSYSRKKYSIKCWYLLSGKRKICMYIYRKVCWFLRLFKAVSFFYNIAFDREHIFILNFILGNQIQNHHQIWISNCVKEISMLLNWWNFAHSNALINIPIPGNTLCSIIENLILDKKGTVNL